ncbi:hypothetical protein NKOR_03895 [Candidatus Nitrosopumilus koreensis AR1]|uniref:Uncharacterized protein n=1 Tax=Candidatus Nitrosopumilus koreensis AR1 TaxID=1229908 RepID=K0B5D2_9ARCH|nr:MULTISPECIES: hypothetical protein [Nitrosopumilus]AFS80669.1 hypothetical protein NKOR_03895 [Candidatus Nitrosopumilus koreensis AR1]
MDYAQLRPNSSEMTQYEFKILEIIQKNPDIHHNGILDLSVPKYMAKKTAQRAIQSLISRGLIFVNKVGRQTQYSFNEGKEQINPDDLRKSVLVWSMFDEHDTKMLEKRYSELSTMQKTGEALFQIQLALQNISQLSLLESLENPSEESLKKERIKLKKRIRKIINLVRKDKDYKIVYPVMMQILSSRKLEFSLNVDRPEFKIKK